MLSKCVPIIVDKWRATWKELSDLIESDGYATFMKPEEYVHLLYDEASFPRSRFYFWAIGCLSAFEDDVSSLMMQLLLGKALIDAWIRSLKSWIRPLKTWGILPSSFRRNLLLYKLCAMEYVHNPPLQLPICGP
jgi:hypothetical protein